MPRIAGRPRDEAAGAAILAAARDLVAAHGYEAVTTLAIAEAAGVGKQTIYRRWPSKAHLVLDAFVAHAHSAVDRATHQSIEPAVRSFLVRTFRALEATGTAIRCLMAHAQGDPGFREDFRTRFIGPRRAALAHVIVEAAARDGAKITAADLDAAVIALFGALWYRLLLDEPLDDDLAARLARLLSVGLSRADAPRRFRRRRDRLALHSR